MSIFEEVNSKYLKFWEQKHVKELYSSICNTIHVDDFSIEEVDQKINIFSLNNKIAIKRFLNNNASNNAQLYSDYGWIWNEHVLIFKFKNGKKCYISYVNESVYRGYIPIITGVTAVIIGGVLIYVYAPGLAKLTVDYLKTNSEKVKDFFVWIYNIVVDLGILYCANKFKDYILNGYSKIEELRGDIWTACLALKLYESYYIKKI